jgi:hypothetical protein
MVTLGKQFIVKGDYGMRCVLCGTGTMHGKKTLKAHLNGSEHATNCFKFEVADRVNTVRILDYRVKTLGLPKWRLEVKVHLLHYVQSHNRDARVVELLARAKSALHKYEKMERLSLLELVVWKASLTSDPFFETMDDLDAYWTLERNFDPVAYKKERRVTSGITVIIQGVLPFLE